MVKSAPVTPSGMIRTRRKAERASPPTWVKPQLAALVKTAPTGPGWLHEIKLDGYRVPRRWPSENPHTTQQRLDGQVPHCRQGARRIAGGYRIPRWRIVRCVARWPDCFQPDQNALEHGDASLIFFAFDLLFLDGEDLTGLPLVDRKTRLEAFLLGAPNNIRYSDPSDRTRPRPPQGRLRTWPRRDRFKAGRRSLRARPPILVKDEMLEPRGIYRRRLV